MAQRKSEAIHLHASYAKPQNILKHRSRREMDTFLQSGLHTGLKLLGYSNPYSLGQAVLEAAEERANIKAQHGTGKVIFLDGRAVEPEHQHLKPAEIRKIRWERGDEPVEVKFRSKHSHSSCWMCGNTIAYGAEMFWIIGTALIRCAPQCSQVDEKSEETT